MDVEVIVDVIAEQEPSSPPEGGPDGGPAGAPAGAPAGELGGDPAAGATSVLEGTAIAVGTLEASAGVLGEDDSRGTGLTVTVKTPVAVGRTAVAATEEGDSTGDPPKSVPLCISVPFVMG
jgi:hypothetical protein